MMARPRADLASERFGRLLVVNVAGRQGQKTMWHCLCECGKEVAVRADNLLGGVQISCGCARAGVVRRPKGEMMPRWRSANAKAARLKRAEANAAIPAFRENSDRPKQFSVSALDDLAKAWK